MNIPRTILGPGQLGDLDLECVWPGRCRRA
jgi:hypothetical protein